MNPYILVSFPDACLTAPLPRLELCSFWDHSMLFWPHSVATICKVNKASDRLTLNNKSMHLSLYYSKTRYLTLVISREIQSTADVALWILFISARERKEAEIRILFLQVVAMWHSEDSGHCEEVLAQKGQDCFSPNKEKKAPNPVECKDREPHLVFPFRSIAFGIKIFSFKERCWVRSKTGWILRPSREKKEGIKIHVLD